MCVQSTGTGCGSDAAGWCLSGLVIQRSLHAVKPGGKGEELEAANCAAPI